MNTLLFDIAENYQLGFQDAASPIMEGIINFYNYVFIYLTFVTIIVIWMIISILMHFKNSTRVIAHKYLIHGKPVPFQKCFKFNSFYQIRLFCTNGSNTPILLYHTPYYEESLIIKKSNIVNYRDIAILTERDTLKIARSNSDQKLSEVTRENLNTAKGYKVTILEKCDSEGFKEIGTFVSRKKVAKFLNMSVNNINLYINSGKLYNNKYKFKGETI